MRRSRVVLKELFSSLIIITIIIIAISGAIIITTTTITTGGDNRGDRALAGSCFTSLNDIIAAPFPWRLDEDADKYRRIRCLLTKSILSQPKDLADYRGFVGLGVRGRRILRLS